MRDDRGVDNKQRVKRMQKGVQVGEGEGREVRETAIGIIS